MVKTGLFKAIDSLIPLDEHLATFRGIGYSLKDKNEAKKGQNRARDWKERKKSRSKSKSKVKDKADIEEMLNGPTQDMDQDSAHIVAASKVPMLKPGEFELWRMRIEQYIQMIDYSLWEVIENGATLPKTQLVEGVMTVMPITSAEDKAQRRLEDAKLLLEAIENRFVGNEATKKTKRNLLKQQYENVTAPSSEMLDQTFDRL
ncbi:hypothetical protein Tco_0802579 [Tanacetum coccineum]|uniref:Uncharacterized protein n=1 Tax=Tanacetum coccineum TaxID=301880 RepID=A0ABQ5A1Y3_9ASTR